ncbi:class III chitinase ChiA1 [Aspergillus fischeri NRRL 181]|uniref:Endochitinase A1 n=1 Tax=Neosartorya fischeri (strain ATCC 1020 / DSM 3700 / CBS 544.65 / FGSC A1164 / JCM 1740 / NRRL 181 / WB 181) TaxID=331117 RepID=A1CZU2_NEOFI|nr:glycosyl hydrolase, family 18, putative [Aspergillus fischeri NRRL 181]EAW24262.1 glycosyl hydrolase, family 18, putative [Aspergillus fischeri NRRL 181]
MVSSKFSLVATAVAALAPLTSAFDASSRSNLAIYWGQGPDQLRLSHFCKETSLDIINIGFINYFPDMSPGHWPGSNFGNQCDGSYYVTNDGVVTKLLSGCHQIMEDIPICQAAGKKVLLSIGGAYPPDQSILSEDSAVAFATFLWGAFGPVAEGWEGPRPFGNVVVDGFDFDIEHNGGFGYATMVNTFRQYFNQVPERKFYLSAAPQCIIPDAQLSDAILNAAFDFIWIQYYNTAACSAKSFIDTTLGKFNFDAWVTILKASASKNAKLYVGLPASETAANQGYYLTPDEVESLVSTYMDRYPDTFGGIMLWEATASENNKIDGAPYADHMKDILLDCDPSPPVTSSSAIPSSTPATSATPSPSSSAVPSSTPAVSETPSPSSSAVPSSTPTPSPSPSPSSSVAPSSSPVSSSSAVASSTPVSSSTPVIPGTSASSSPVPSSSAVASSTPVSSSTPVIPGTSVSSSAVSSSTAVASSSPVSSSTPVVPGTSASSSPASSSSPVASSTPASSSTPVIPGGSSSSSEAVASSTPPITLTLTVSPTPAPSSSGSSSTDLSSSTQTDVGTSPSQTAGPSTTATATTSSSSSSTDKSSTTVGSGNGNGSGSTTTTAATDSITAAPTVTSSAAATGASSEPVTITTVIVTSYIDICPTGFTTVTTTYTTTYCPGTNTATATATVTNPPSGPGGAGSQTTAPAVPEGWTTTVTVCTQCAAKPTTVTLTLPVTETGSKSTDVVPAPPAATGEGSNPTQPSGASPTGGAGGSSEGQVPPPAVTQVSTSTDTVTVVRPTSSRPLILGTGTVRPSSTLAVKPSAKPSGQTSGSGSHVPIPPSYTQEVVSPLSTGAASRMTGLGHGLVLTVLALSAFFVL